VVNMPNSAVLYLSRPMELNRIVRANHGDAKQGVGKTVMCPPRPSIALFLISEECGRSHATGTERSTPVAHVPVQISGPSFA
jgi:hypothetical protein